VFGQFWVYLWGIETNLKYSFCHKKYLRFESTYEELKPGCDWNCEAGANSVLSLPMRNWNFPIPHNLAKIQTVLSLPMRNWNFISNTAGEYLSGVLSLPMRNWNLNWLGSPAFVRLCFESTYEELKPNCRYRRTSGHTCFESTYEELKPALQAIISLLI